MTENPFVDPGAGTKYVPRGDAEARAKVPRDSYDRYRMPLPDGTMPAANRGKTRVSTTKSALSNQEGIRVWGEGKVAEGVATNPDLIEAIARAHTDHALPDADKAKVIRKLAKEAFERAGGKDRSGKGTAFHELTEKRNAGEDVQPPAEWADSLGNYYRALKDAEIEILPQWLEITVDCPYEHQGTFDNMVRVWNPDTEEYELRIADLKTGRDLSKGWLEILIQLWFYANAYRYWTTTAIEHDEKTGQVIRIEGYWTEMPRELRRDRAYVFHVPLDGRVMIYDLDLSGVERAVAAAVEGRRWNAEAKHRVRLVSETNPAAFVAPADVAGHSTGAELAAKEAGYAAVPTGNGFAAQVTPQMLADQVKASERLASVTEELREKVAPGLMAVVLNGEGKPLAPLAETIPGKKGCSVCRRTGHRKGSPACLGTADPEYPRAAPPATGEPLNTTNLPEAAEVHTEPPTGEIPWCIHPAPEWTSTHPFAPGQWVCTQCGKPSEPEYRRTHSPNPDFGPVPAPQTPTEKLATARTKADVLAIRAEAQESGIWTQVFDTKAMARWQELP